jgi:hypothetical protein
MDDRPKMPRPHQKKFPQAASVHKAPEPAPKAPPSAPPRIDPIGGEPRLEDILGPPCLIVGEDPVAYAALSGQIFAELKPVGIISQTLVRDLVARTWEIMRYQRQKAGYLSVQSVSGLRRVLEVIGETPQQVNDYVKGWACGNKGVRAYVMQRLTTVGLGIEAAHGVATVNALKAVEAIETLILQTERRRDKLLRLIEVRDRELAGRAARVCAVLDAAAAAPPDGHDGSS